MCHKVLLLAGDGNKMSFVQVIRYSSKSEAYLNKLILEEQGVAPVFLDEGSDFGEVSLYVLEQDKKKRVIFCFKIK